MTLIKKLFLLLNRNFKIVTLLLVSVITGINYAQVPELSFRYFSKNDGLKSSNIFDIIQDDSGYLWIGSLNGINKFDGSTFYSYESNPNDSLTPPGNFIRKFLIDSKGILWIATTSGLCTYNSVKDNFIRVSEVGDQNGLPSNDFVDLIEDNQGNIIVLVDNSIYQYNQTEKSFTQLVAIEKDIGTCLLTDDKNNLWIGTKNSGIIKYNLANKNIRYLRKLENENSLSHNHVLDLQIWNNKLWIATMGDGVNSMSLTSGEFIRYNVPGPDAVFCFKLYIDNHDNLWSIDYTGLKYFDATSQQFLGFYPIANDPFSIKTAVKGIYQDAADNYWVYNEPGGLAISTARFGFQHFGANTSNYWHTSNPKITAIHEDQYGNLWMGNAATGIDVFYWQKGVIETFWHNPSDPKSIGGGAVQCIYRDVQNRMWISTYHSGLQRYNGVSNNFETYDPDPTDSLSISGKDIRSIREMNDGRLLITVHGKGLDIHNPETGEFEHFTKDKNNLSNEWTFDALEDARGNIWVACSWGLSLLKKGEDVFNIYFNIQDDTNSISDSHVHCLLEDSNGNIWAGTINGLNKYSYATNSFTRYGDKLESAYICSIQEDYEGNIWVGTLAGVSKIIPKTGKVENFGVSEGIRAGEFFPRSSFKNSMQHIFFGGSNGIELIKPKEILDKSHKQKIIISSLKLFNDEVTYVTNPEILNGHISHISELNLKHDQNFITLGYGALNFLNPEKDNYAYRLEGFDKDWHFVGNKREAVYTNLDPGNYIFTVKARNSDHIWSKVPATISISITPPWYGTIAFKIVIIIILLGIVFLITYIRTHQLRSQQIILRNTVEEKTKALVDKNEELKNANALLIERQDILEQQSEEIKAQSNRLEDNNIELQSLNATKDRLFSIIAHDLLSPFNAILGFSELMVRDFNELTDEEKLQDSKIINQSTVKVFSLLQNLLFWARSQTKGLKCHPETINLNIILEDTLSLQHELILNKNIQALMDFEDNVMAFADIEMVKTIARNLVSNAIKFSPPDDKITIRLYNDPENRMAVFSVSDNGSGMPAKTIDDIQNSRQIEPGEGSMGEKGSGLGLTVCYEFVEINHGELHIESSVGAGSNFIISLPSEKK